MPTLTPEQRAEAEAQLREVQVRDREQHDHLLRDAQAVYQAVEGWHLVENAEAWAKTCEEARADHHSGRFLIERLGAARLLDPPLMATLLGLRQTMLAELGTATAAEQMLVDHAARLLQRAPGPGVDRQPGAPCRARTLRPGRPFGQAQGAVRSG